MGAPANLTAFKDRNGKFSSISDVPFAKQNSVQIPSVLENCRRPSLPTFGSYIPHERRQVRTLIQPIESIKEKIERTK